MNTNESVLGFTIYKGISSLPSPLFEEISFLSLGEGLSEMHHREVGFQISSDLGLSLKEFSISR